MLIATSEFSDELCRFREASGLQRPVWIGLAGCPGSGKSTIAENVRHQSPNEVCIIPMDGYHFRRQLLDVMNDPQAAHARRGAPFTFDADRFVADLLAAKESGQGSFPAFEHGIADPVEDAIPFEACQTSIVLVEGNYLLLDSHPWNRLASEVFDLTCWLDVSVHESCERVHQRNTALGMTEQKSRQKVEGNDRLNAELVSQNGSDVADWLIVSR